MTRPYSAKDHLPAELYSAAQVRALDEMAIGLEGNDGFELMKRAGEAAFACLLERWPEEANICVFAGPGNNGGDAYVLAALACYHGIDVVFYTLGDHSALSQSSAQTSTQASQQAREMALEAGVEPQMFVPSRSLSPQQELLFEGRVIVDGIFGTGLQRAVDGDSALAIHAINRHWGEVLALDLPSGLHADSGTVLGCAVEASLTVTFIGVKQGLLTADGPDVCGAIAFASLAIDSQLYHQQNANCERISWDRLERLGQRLPARRGNSHKGQFGRVTLIGGGHGMGGAVLMAAEAAARSGAGLIRCATHGSHVGAIMMRRPEVMTLAVESGLELQPYIATAESDDDEAQQAANQHHDVLACGPGLGRGSWAELLLQQVLAVNTPLVLDADALNLLASPGWECDFSERDVVLTPHPGEAARLLNCDIATVQADRFSAAQKLADRYQAVVVLKGQGSIIAQPESSLTTALDDDSNGMNSSLNAAINPCLALCSDGNAGMAGGGMGDVLTGVISALMAQGLSPWQAARLGVCSHSAAADMAVKKGGARGLLASDLMPYLQQLMN